MFKPTEDLTHTRTMFIFVLYFILRIRLTHSHSNETDDVEMPVFILHEFYCFHMNSFSCKCTLEIFISFIHILNSRTMYTWYNCDVLTYYSHLYPYSKSNMRNESETSQSDNYFYNNQIWSMVTERATKTTAIIKAQWIWSIHSR